MRRKGFFALMIGLALLLSACGDKGDSEKFQKFRDTLSGKTIKMTAQVYGENLGNRVEYTLSCTAQDGVSQVEVLLPADLYGVTARISENGNTVEYEGVVLAVGEDTAQRVSPVSSLPIVAQSLEKGWIKNVWREELESVPCLAVSFVKDEDTTVTVWLHYGDMTPLYAEVSTKEKVCVSCAITDWRLE